MPPAGSSAGSWKLVILTFVKLAKPVRASQPKLKSHAQRTIDRQILGESEAGRGQEAERLGGDLVRSQSPGELFLSDQVLREPREAGEIVDGEERLLIDPSVTGGGANVRERKVTEMKLLVVVRVDPVHVDRIREADLCREDAGLLDLAVERQTEASVGRRGDVGAVDVQDRSIQRMVRNALEDRENRYMASDGSRDGLLWTH